MHRPTRRFPDAFVLTGQGISTTTVCRVLPKRDRRYRAWRDSPLNQRGIRHAMLTDTIANIHQASLGCYESRGATPNSCTASVSL